MIKILEVPEDNRILISVAIAGLKETDWKTLISELQKKIQTYGKIRWYFEMEDFQQDSKKIYGEEVGLYTLPKDGFERIAIVGNKDCHGWMKELMAPFASAEIKSFETNHQDTAHQWVSS